MFKTSITFIAAMFTVAFMLSGTAGADLLLDDFTDDTLSSEYVQSTVDTFGAGETLYSFDTTTNDNQLTVLSDSGAVGNQNELLRDDVSLDIGETLLVDVDPSNVSRDLTGLSIYTTKTPANRNSSIVIGYSGSLGNLLSWYFNDSGTFTFGFHGAPTGIVESFFIERTGADTFDLGYINTDSDSFVVRTVDTTGQTAPGNAVGVHVDLNPDSSAIFDNLRIIPEPASLVLLGLGGLLMLRRRHAT